ncbi:MAG TPA: precorrin-8X methylmutase [Planctomycetota bacterium]|jgi:precorrin isomerase
MSSSRRALVRALYENPLSGEQIEAASFAAIDRESPSHSFTPEQWAVVRRMIHTTADFGLMEEVRFSTDAIASAIAALRGGAAIYSDSNMIRAGLSIARLRRVCPKYDAGSLVCHVADEDVAAEARVARLPRAIFSVRKAQSRLNGGIVLFGNSPVGLMEVNRLILEENLRPALVVGMPVGFVHVVESKQELMSLPVPYIALAGRRGGSPLAVSVVHALASLADSKDGACGA